MAIQIYNFFIISDFSYYYSKYKHCSVCIMLVVTHQVSYQPQSGGVREVRKQNVESGEHGGRRTFDLVWHECVHLVLMLEALVPVHAVTHFEFRTHFQVSSATSELSCAA